MKRNNATLVGIDWADKTHDFYLILPNGETHSGRFNQNPKDIAKTVQLWTKLAAEAPIAVAIEASKGALINALLQVPEITIYPVNPNAFANYRKSYAHGGGKTDPDDARLIAQFLRERIDALKPLKHNLPITRQLASLVEDRRRLVNSRADLSNELLAVLKQYFPALLDLKPARFYSEFFLKLLLAYPTLDQAQKAGKATLRNFFHGVRMKANADRYAERLLNAAPLTNDEVLIEALSRRAVALAEQMQVLTKHIRRYNADLKRLLPEHPDYAMAKSFPGASTITQARILAALGDDRSRYPTSASLQAASGIAPITEQSGKRKYVSARWATSKFLKQTFHEYAGLSIPASRWAKVFYESQISAGKSVHAAKRALAYKWERIIHACWESGEPYDEDRYIRRLAVSGAPLYQQLKTGS